MRLKEKRKLSGARRLRLLAAWVIAGAVPWRASAGTGPGWWYNPALTTSGTAAVGQTGTNDYAAVNQGQVKNLAVTAVNDPTRRRPLTNSAAPADLLDTLALALTTTLRQHQ